MAIAEKKEKGLKINELEDMAWRGYEAMRPHRNLRYAMMSEYAGSNYNVSVALRPVIVNDLEQLVTVMTSLLAPQDLRCLMITDDPRAARNADNLRIAVNDSVEKVGLANAMSLVIADAIFGLGTLRCGLAGTGGLMPSDEEDLDPGEAYVSRIDFDDMVCDMRAKSWKQQRMIGNFYRVPEEVFRATDKIDGEDKDRVKADVEDESRDGSNAVHEIGGDSRWGDDKWDGWVTLLDVWVPRHETIYTLDGLRGAGRLLMKSKPGADPYHPLGFRWLSNNVLPIGPAANVFDLHCAENRIYRKIIRQTDRQKEVHAVGGGDEKDARKFIDANDGDYISTNAMDAPATIRTGGPDNSVLATGIHLGQKFSKQAGNLDLVGGLGASSPTATQDQQLGAAGGVRISAMRREVMEVIRGVMEKLAAYAQSNPLLRHKTTLKYGVASITREIGPEDVQIEGSYRVDVEPYVSGFKSPEQRMAEIDRFMSGFILPAAGLLAQTGNEPDFGAYLRIKQRYGMSELSELVKARPEGRAEVQDRSHEAGAGYGNAGGGMQGPRGRSESTPQGQENEMMQQLMTAARSNGA